MDDVPIRGEELSAPIYWTGRQWAVTSYGVECRDGTYSIDKYRLWENTHGHSWEDHMAEKGWVDMPDFRQAMAFARKKMARFNPEQAK